MKTKNAFDLLFKCFNYYLFKERDCLALQLDKIEAKAMKTFSQACDPDVDEIDLDTIVAKQMVDLKSKLGWLSVEFCF